MREDATDHARLDSEGDAPPGDSLSRVPTPSSSERGGDGQGVSVRPSSTKVSLSGFTDRVDPGEASSVVKPTLDDGQSATPATEESDAGTVSLVGSGPGDPDLLTRRAWKRLSKADVVLHDSLTGEEILDELPEGVEIVDVGKRPPDRTTQGEINELMRERSNRGERVVRLKGGDPNVFGRGGEEAEYLASEDVGFEIVPGVSSVLAAPSASAIPLTHRDRASSVTVITGHETPDKDESALNWSALAETVTSGGTLVVLMGVRRLQDNVRALRNHEVPPETPAAMVQKATWRDEKTVVGTLDTITEKSEAAGIESPAVTIVGDVVEVREEVEDWFLH